MSLSARARLPISSRREGRRGTTTSRARPSLTRTAARASRRNGRTIVRARNSDRKIETSDTIPSTTLSRNRSLRTVWVMSRALAVVITTSPSPSAAAAVMTGVRSGARQIVAGAVCVVRAVRTSGHSPPAAPLAIQRRARRIDDGVDHRVEEARGLLAPILRRRVDRAGRCAAPSRACRPPACRRA